MQGVTRTDLTSSLLARRCQKKLITSSLKVSLDWINQKFTNKWYYLILHSFHIYMHRNSWYNLKFIIIFGTNKISIPFKHLDSIRSNQFISYPDIWYICQYCKFFNVLLVSSGNRIYSVNLIYLVHFYQISDNSVDILVCLLIILMIISLYFLFANICKLRHKKYKNYNK